ATAIPSLEACCMSFSPWPLVLRSSAVQLIDAQDSSDACARAAIPISLLLVFSRRECAQDGVEQESLSASSLALDVEGYICRLIAHAKTPLLRTDTHAARRVRRQPARMAARLRLVESDGYQVGHALSDPHASQRPPFARDALGNVVAGG